MNYGVYLGLVVALCVALVWRLKLNSLYVLFTFAFVQNLALPFMYTSLGASRDLLLGLLLFKEVLLLLLFLYCTHLWSELERPWPKPLFVLFLFTLYCVSRVTIGLLFLHDDPYESFKKAADGCFSPGDSYGRCHRGRDSAEVRNKVSETSNVSSGLFGVDRDTSFPYAVKRFLGIACQYRNL